MAFTLMSFSLTRLNNEPRLGDSMIREELKNNSITSDSIGYNINLSKCKIDREWEVIYMEPALNDTISSITLSTMSRNIAKLVGTSYGIAVINESKPGQKLYYTKPYPEFVLTSDTTALFSGKGRKGSLTPFKTQGTWHSSLQHDASLITPECDTLKNLTCAELNINSDIQLEVGDSIFIYAHKGTRRQWYAMGYRYPILEMNEHVFYIGDSIVDSSKQWSYLSTQNQEIQIENDIENETLREAIRNNIFYSRSTQASNYSTHANIENKQTIENPNINNLHNVKVATSFMANLDWDISTQIAKIILSSNSTNTITVFATLCDSGGKVLQHEKIDLNGHGVIRFSMQNYQAGIYFALIESGIDNVSFKFIKP